MTVEVFLEALPDGGEDALLSALLGRPSPPAA